MKGTSRNVNNNLSFCDCGESPMRSLSNDNSNRNGVRGTTTCTDDPNAAITNSREFLSRMPIRDKAGLLHFEKDLEEEAFFSRMVYI